MEYTVTPPPPLPSTDAREPNIPLQYHIIGIEGLIQNETSKYVHHFVVKAYDDVDDCGQSCKDWLTEMNPDSAPHAYYSSSSGPCDFSFSNIFIWAPGAKNLELPDDVGIKNFQSVAIETHYNNPDGDAGQVDNSGVRVYYTETLRPMDMGIMQLADPYVGLMGMPLPSGKSHFSFSCPSSCSEEYFEVTVNNAEAWSNLPVSAWCCAFQWCLLRGYRRSTFPLTFLVFL